jgi:hypothetical protein
MATAELMLDAEALFEALDRKRRRLKWNRQNVAEELGVAACTVSYWGAGGRIGSDSALRACVWLDRDLRDFAKRDEAAKTLRSRSRNSKSGTRRVEPVD